MPKVVRMEFWREVKAFWDASSDCVLRETVISTILPEDIEGGRRMEGNSICRKPVSQVLRSVHC